MRAPAAQRAGDDAPVAVVSFMNDEGWEWGKIAAGGTMSAASSWPAWSLIVISFWFCAVAT